MATSNPYSPPRRPFEDRVREAAIHMEEDLKRVVAYINDEVVPDVRRNGSRSLREAAAELHRLAERVEDANRRTPPPPR
jgi:hypothetical protein